MSEDTNLDDFVEKERESADGFKETAAGRIPSDWDTKNVERLCELRNGKATNHIEIGESEYLVYGSNGPIGSHSESNFDGGLIFGRVGAVGEVERVRQPVWVSDNAIQATVNNRCNTDFLYYYLSNKELSSLATKTAQPLLNQSTIGNVTVPTPLLSEQRKIATVLHNVDQAIQKTEEIIEQTLKIKNRTIDRLTMKGVDHDNFKHVDTSLRFFELEIPEEWEKVSYEDISSNITYGFTSPMPEAESGPWMVTAKDIKNGRVNYSTARKTTEEAFSERLTSKSRPEPGTVLITKDGTLGNVAIVDREGICINQSVASINPNQEKVRPEFLALTLTSPLTRKLTESFNPQTTIGHIKISELAEWELGLPPISEQEEIVSIVESIQKKYRSEKEYKNSLQRLKSGLMQDLLSGTVRTTDTNIEVLDEIAQHG